MTSDANGVLFVNQNGGAWFGAEGEPGVQRIDDDGTVRYIAQGFDAPNDICFGPDGRLYFTDPGRSTDVYDPAKVKPGRLFSCEPDGSALEFVHEGILFVNGLAFDPSGTILYLAETATRRVLAAPFHGDHLGDLSVVVELDNRPVALTAGIAARADGTESAPTGGVDQAQMIGQLTEESDAGHVVLGRFDDHRCDPLERPADNHVVDLEQRRGTLHLVGAPSSVD